MTMYDRTMIDGLKDELNNLLLFVRLVRPTSNCSIEHTGRLAYSLQYLPHSALMPIGPFAPTPQISWQH